MTENFTAFFFLQGEDKVGMDIVEPARNPHSPQPSPEGEGVDWFPEYSF
jgi:hypothetical protein